MGFPTQEQVHEEEVDDDVEDAFSNCCIITFGLVRRNELTTCIPRFLEESQALSHHQLSYRATSIQDEEDQSVPIHLIVYRVSPSSIDEEDRQIFTHVLQNLLSNQRISHSAVSPLLTFSEMHSWLYDEMGLIEDSPGASSALPLDP